MPVSSAGRSRIMKAIRSKNTKPELAVRKVVHRLGYRYRLHIADLPGKPDLVFAARKKVIFVNGCFWHRHPSPRCANARWPQTNVQYWKRKLARNVERDLLNLSLLRNSGWKALVVWECEVKNELRLAKRLARFLGPK